MSVYYNFINIIKELRIDYNTLFIKYKYNFISNLLFRNKLTFYENYILICAYMKYLFNDNYGKNTKLYDYLIFYKFSTASINIIDDICVYIDDGNIKTYSLNNNILLCKYICENMFIDYTGQKLPNILKLIIDS